jgi:hypothetical protein
MSRVVLSSNFIHHRLVLTDSVREPSVEISSKRLLVVHLKQKPLLLNLGVLVDTVLLKQSTCSMQERVLIWPGHESIRRV